LVEQEPPCVTSHGGNSNINSNDEVSEKQPFPDEGLSAIARRYAHDGVVGWIEAKGGSRETVCHEIYPKQLHRDESFRHAQEDGQKDAEREDWSGSVHTIGLIMHLPDDLPDI